MSAVYVIKSQEPGIVYRGYREFGLVAVQIRSDVCDVFYKAFCDSDFHVAFCARWTAGGEA